MADDLFSIKNEFYLGNYMGAINEAQSGDLELSTPADERDRDVIVRAPEPAPEPAPAHASEARSAASAACPVRASSHCPCPLASCLSLLRRAADESSRSRAAFARVRAARSR